LVSGQETGPDETMRQFRHAIFIMMQYFLLAERRIARGEEIGYTQAQDTSSEQVAVVLLQKGS
jgi:hypothetical protein